MPIVQLDPSLINSGGGVNSFQNAFANALKMRASQQEVDDNQYKMDAIREDRGQQNALAQLLANQGFDPKSAQGQAQMYGAGGVKNTQGYLKSQSDIAETGAKTNKEMAGTRKVDLENYLQKFDIMDRLMSPVKDQYSYDVMRQQAAKDPLLADMATNMPATYEPEKIAAGRMQAMSIKDKIAAELAQSIAAETGRSHRANEKISVDNNTATNKTSRDNNFDNNKRIAADAAAGRSVTMRGQNLVDARSRESNASGKAPSGYRWKNDGSLEAIPGGPAGKTASATEGERKAATLLQRLEGSEKQMSAALGENPAAAKPGLVASGLRSVGAEALANTTAVGSERQRVEAAQLDMLDAALTLGTGAAYTKEQLEGYRKSYFPQIGDTKDNVSDKKARLDNVIKAAKIAAGRASPPSTPAGGGNSDIDALLNKYK